jgi:NADH-quinone oxidoreductase subunit E
MKPGIAEVLELHEKGRQDSLIPILQEIQEREGYLSEEAVTEVGKHLDIPSSRIYGVATFYNQFRFQPTGKYHILVCRGTACHVLGSATVLDHLEKLLHIKAGQTTRDGLFSIEIVACIGACGLAPVINVSGEFHARVDEASIAGIIEEYGKREETL